MNILVCVTQQKTCERLINKAHELAREYGGNLFVINVVRSDMSFLESSRESEALEYLFGISKKVGANLAVLKSDDVVKTIAEYADENDIDYIVIGKSHDKNAGDRFVKKLKSMLKNDAEIRVLS
ncbi:MAG TPA: universal stress protein [Clostridiales bacterium]|nr:universal stress protein [Clostridiales bacterium]HPV02121.1 universal stress protein [Clostridiales bacterium]